MSANGFINNVCTQTDEIYCREGYQAIVGGEPPFSSHRFQHSLQLLSGSRQLALKSGVLGVRGLQVGGKPVVDCGFELQMFHHMRVIFDRPPTRQERVV